MSAAAGFAEKARILKLAEQIQARLFHAQQVKLSGQQSVNPQGHVAQAEEIQRRLTEAVLRLQEAARDYSIQGISKRLEIMSRKLNLLFDVQSTSQATSCFLSCADFYLEVGFHDNRLVSSVKLVHTHLPSPREPLTLDSVLSDHMYHRLEAHLSGLLQVYSQAEGQERGQVFRALSATESVLLSINKHSQSSSLHDTIMTQPLGLLTPRYGGLPMKLTYFQHPHEVLTTPPSLDHVTSRDQEMGVSANVLVEKSTQPFLISLDPNLLRFEKQGFDPVTSSNGASLSVTFVLQHMAPIPVCAVIMDRIHSIVFRSQMTPFSGVHINALIARTAAEKAGKEVSTNEYHVVPLPSQSHYYRVPAELSTPTPPTLSSSSSPDTGTSLLVVPFLHPGSVVPLVKLLRKQLVYNSLLTSLLGRSPPSGHTPSSGPAHSSHDYVFDLCTQPPELLTVTLCIAKNSDENVVFEFSVDPLRVTLKVGVAQTVSKELSNIVSRCLSIPVTLYAALKRPDSLLGPKVAALIKAHHKETCQYTATVSGSI